MPTTISSPVMNLPAPTVTNDLIIDRIRHYVKNLLFKQYFGHIGSHGMTWDGMGWDGMGWDGMGWDGTVLKINHPIPWDSLINFYPMGRFFSSHPIPRGALIHTVICFWILCRNKFIGIIESNIAIPGIIANCICL